MGVNCFQLKQAAQREQAMNIGSSKLLAIEVFALFSLLSHIIWLSLYVASKQWPIDARPILRRLKILRWVSWGLAGTLGLLAVARNHFPIYGLAMSTFSTGLSFPGSWLKRRFAGDLTESPNTQLT
jgi:hypothetical protein